jgi:hypothetical protein
MSESISRRIASKLFERGALLAMLELLRRQPIDVS